MQMQNCGDSRVSSPSPPSAKRPRTAQSDQANALSASMAELVQYPLVAREMECETVECFLERCLIGNGEDCRARGGCLYVSGSPGTGKTRSVRATTTAWRRRYPETQILELNCMDLAQRTPAGVLHRISELASAQNCSGDTRVAKATSCSMQSIAVATTAQLTRLGPTIVLIADEVDQLVKKLKGNCNLRDGNNSALETLLSLPLLPGAPKIAIIAIANAIDLLERTIIPTSLNPFQSLLFESYTVEQLRKIAQAYFTAAGAHGAARLHALGSVPLELRIRQVAKQSGDCRQVVNFCEQVLCETNMAYDPPPPTTPSVKNMPSLPLIVHADTPAENANHGTNTFGASAVLVNSGGCGLQTPPKRPLLKHQQNDPLRILPQLPLEQQILLCALAGASNETVRFVDVYSRYKELCKRLHQPCNLASKEQVSNALSALEQRGLLGLHKKKTSNGTRTSQGKGSRLGGNDCIAELSVSRKAMREKIAEANPILEQCLM